MQFFFSSSLFSHFIFFALSLSLCLFCLNFFFFFLLLFVAITALSRQVNSVVIFLLFFLSLNSRSCFIDKKRKREKKSCFITTNNHFLCFVIITMKANPFIKTKPRFDRALCKCNIK